MLIGDTAKGAVRAMGSVGVGVSAVVVEMVEEDGDCEGRERGDVTTVWVGLVLESVRVAAKERPVVMGDGEERIAVEEEEEVKKVLEPKLD